MKITITQDFTLSRNLSDAFKIQDLLVLAYNAGKAGEADKRKQEN